MMKKTILFLVILGIALCLPAAQAQAWPPGRSPAQPYEGVPEVDLKTRLGYIMLFPREKVPTEFFCDRLELFLPRDDVTQGEGKLRLYTGKRDLVIEVSFQDESVVKRPLTEEEMIGLMWGGGVCFEVRLPVSLTLNQDYYVEMDAGCIVAADGSSKNPAVRAKDAWTPRVTGDYGISGLTYAPAPEPSEAAAAAADAPLPDATRTAPDAAEPDADAAKDALVASEPAEAEAPAPEAAEPAEAEAPAQDAPEAAESADGTHAVGERFSFDLVLGGDATAAVIYSPNDSVDISELEYTESGPITGVVTGESPKWSVIFLNANGDILHKVDCCR